MSAAVAAASSSQTLKRTPLFDRHVDAGAKLVPFAGWEMPVQYGGIREEHLAVRTACGVFDVSHMGEIETSGPQAADLLQRLLSNDVAKIAVGGAQYSVLCREDGGVLDDLFTYRLGPDRFLTVTNAANHDKDLAWFRAHAGGFDAEVADAHERYAMLAVQGPRARGDRPGDGRRAAAGALRHRPAHAAGRSALVCGTGYTGEDGVELLCDPADAPALWDDADAARAPPPRAWPRATRCASRSASTSTATTSWRSAARSRRAWAGAARRTRASSAPTPCAPSRDAGPSEKLAPFTLDGAGHPAPGQPGGRRRRGDERHAVAMPGHGDRHGLRARRARPAGHRARDRRARQGAPRRGGHQAALPQGERWLTRATPRTSSTTPSTTGPASTATTATFGITWFAQDALGEVVFFDPPEVGTTVTKDEPYAEVESVKAVSDVIAPMSGEIVEVNAALGDKPEPINDDPYGDGWLVRVKLSDPGEQSDLLDAAAYTATLS